MCIFNMNALVEIGKGDIFCLCWLENFLLAWQLRKKKMFLMCSQAEGNCVMMNSTFLTVSVVNTSVVLSFQYINYGNLEQLLDSNQHLPWTVRVKLAYDIAMGISYLHYKGIFHRDLTSKVLYVK